MAIGANQPTKRQFESAIVPGCSAQPMVTDWSKFSAKYRRTIMSKRFAALKARLVREVGRCEMCSAPYVFRKRSLTLHHKHYRTLGRETRCDLLLVCGTCHKEIHGKRKRNNTRGK